MLHGTPASEGIGLGRVMIVEEAKLEYNNVTVTDTEAEVERFRNAVKIFCDNTAAQADALKASAGKKEAEILEGHIQMMKDPYMCGEIEKLIDNGQCAEAALEYMCDMFISMFSATDDELTQQRAADVKDLKTSMLSILLGVKEVKLSAAPKGTVVVAKELTPSMTAGINKENIVGIITETGGKTSHSAILARALEIPAVLSVNGAVSKLSAGAYVIVDGSEGVVIDEPDDAVIQEYDTKRINFLKERKELENFRGKATKALSGEEYELFCNIGKPEDAIKAVDADGEGVGLFRTEFLFMDRTALPTEDEQFDAYKKAALTLKGKPVIIRTLDIGADKQCAYFNMEHEENPALGYRAIRICLTQTDVFKTQLRALFRASAYGKLSIMYPMITSLWEVRKIKEIVEEVKAELDEQGIAYGEPKQGIMIETPAAVMVSGELAKEVDFFSIGTNDLTQYTLAVDRQNPKLDRFFDPHHPAILAMIRMVVENAHKAGIWAGICGELGADTSLTKEFLAMGVDELSVSAGSILPIRKIILETDLSQYGKDIK